MKTLNTVGPNINPWRSPLVTGRHLEQERFATTLWMQLVSQFPAHRTNHLPRLTCQFLQEEAVGNCIQSLGQIQVDNVHCLPHINQAGYLVVEDDQVCQARFTLGESVLAFPNHVLHLSCSSPQEDLFHNFNSD